MSQGETWFCNNSSMIYLCAEGQGTQSKGPGVRPNVHQGEVEDDGNIPLQSEARWEEGRGQKEENKFSFGHNEL